MGLDSVPYIFRRPIAYVNICPLGYLTTSSPRFLTITKHHIARADDQELSLRDIFSRGVGFCDRASQYDAHGVFLRENTPEEIRDVAIEMAERLNGTWQPHEDDEFLQRRFWEIFPADAVDPSQGRRLHGEIRSRFGACFLRDNRDWLR